jgi:hypothetical protein
MPQSDLFTPAQIRAWDYIDNAYGRDMLQTEALSAYRSGGGQIRTVDWGELWHRFGEAKAAWGTIVQYKNNDTIPESAYSDTNTKYRNPYTVVYKANVRDDEGNILHDIYRQIGFDTRPTLGEINTAMEENLLAEVYNSFTEIYQTTGLEFYRRV